jgi:hypothetical protein
VIVRLGLLREEQNIKSGLIVQNTHHEGFCSLCSVTICQLLGTWQYKKYPEIFLLRIILGDDAQHCSDTVLD